MLRLRRTLFCSLALVATSAMAAQTPKYNVLFLMSDDLRPELGCYGHPTVKSPNIDALAATGVRFDRHYVQYPLCNPSRSSMLNGRYPTTTGVLDNNTWFGALHPEFISLPKFFKQNGYAALRTGKIFHGGIDDFDAWTEGGEPRNFEGPRTNPPPRPNRALTSDRWNELDGDGEEHADYKTADTAIDYLKRYRDKPFFLCCGFTKPHSPPTGAKKFFDQYRTATVDLPPDFAARAAALPGFPPASITPSSDLFMSRDASPAEAKDMIRAYWASTSWMDWNLGRVMAELDRQKLREKTIVLFWGDHGYHLGEKGKWSKHGSLYETGTRVPFIVSVPGGPKGVCPRITESVDIYPTLVDLCGLAPPGGLQGESLAPLLKDPGAKWNEPAFSVYAGGGKLAAIAVRGERFRYAIYDSDNGAEMLIDEQADPHELKNLANDPAYAVEKEKLAALVREFRARETGKGK